ncbi:Transcription factor bye1, partial [Dimargaris xerosporica]
MNPPQTAAKQVIDLSTLTLPGSRPVFRPTGRRQGSNHPYSQPTSDHSPLVTMPTVITGSSGGSPTAPVAPVTSHNANPVKRRGRPPKSSRANPFQKSISPPIIQVNPEPPGPALSSDSLPSVEVVVEFPPFPSFQSIADPQRKPKMYEQIVNLALSPNIVTGSRKLRPPPLSEHPNTTCLCKGTVRQPRMIQCDCCIKWYHLSCVHITIWRSRLLRTFVCPPCDRWIHAYTRFDTSRFRRKRQSIVSDLDNEKPFSNACSTSTVVTPVLKRKRSPQPRPQSDDELTDYNPTGTSANQSLQRKPRQRTKATKARSPPEPPSATKRMSTRVRILNILLKILTEAAALTDNPGSITTAQIETLATQIEEETFQQFGVKVDGQVRSCGPRYAAKCRSLRYNLTDPSNPGPRNGLFSGRITPQVLVSLSPEALAPEQIRLLAQEIKQKSIRQSTITEKNAPRMIKKSHKGEVELIPTLFVAMEPDTAAARRENPLGQPSRHRGDENLDDDTLRLSEYLMWKNNQPSTASAGGKDADHSLAHPPSSTTVTQPQVVIPSISELQTPALAKPSPST